MRIRPGLLIPLMLVMGQSADSQTLMPLGSEFQVNSYTTGAQTSPSVAVDAQGHIPK